MPQTPEEIAALRLKLLANGYTPIPNRDKRTFTKGWPTLQVDAELIADWARRKRRDTASGIRVENSLAVIDLDLPDAALMQTVGAQIEDLLDGWGIDPLTALVRHGKDAKEAWFVRTAETFSRIHTRRWLKPGSTTDDDTFCVEIFGGAAHRQFGSYGPHTVDDEGNVMVEYRWEGKGPADVPLAELPVLTKDQFFLLADVAERELKAAGYEPVKRSTSGENDVARIYDLEEGMVFACSDGVDRTLEELREAAAAGSTVRCSASFVEGPEAKRRDRCLVSVDRSGGVVVWESASGVTHCEAAREPHDYQIDIDRAAEKLRELEEKHRYKLRTVDSIVATAAKIRELYAYRAEGAGSVVPIWTNNLDSAGMTMGSFRMLMLPYSEVEIGPKGGEKRVNPADLWSVDERRVTVAGLRLRPDQPRPIYDENGEQFINIYDPPTHLEAGGEIETGLEFMEALLPEASERAWFLQWLAHKLRYPHIPGPAVVMVARKQGTGRGTLGVLLGKLFGENYVRTVPYSTFAGKNSQAQYTGWAASALLAIVNESSEAEGGSLYSSKRDTYEHLKEIVEPRPSLKYYVMKGTPSFTGMSFMSTLIATNNPDALPIPAEDRRFAVLTNGPPREPAFWVRLNRWLLDPANVAAFARHLHAVDLAGYSPFEAPAATEGKRTMIDESQSDLDHALEQVLGSFPADVFVLQQIEAGIRQAMQLYDYDLPDKWATIARKMAKRMCYRVGDTTVEGRVRPMIDGKRYDVFARTSQTARTWAKSDSSELRSEVLKNGSPAASGLPGNVLVGLFDRSKE